MYEVSVVSVAILGKEKNWDYENYDVEGSHTPVLSIAVKASTVRMGMCVNFRLLTGVYLALHYLFILLLFKSYDF